MWTQTSKIPQLVVLETLWTHEDICLIHLADSTQSGHSQISQWQIVRGNVTGQAAKKVNGEHVCVGVIDCVRMFALHYLNVNWDV